MDWRLLLLLAAAALLALEPLALESRSAFSVLSPLDFLKVENLRNIVGIEKRKKIKSGRNVDRTKWRMQGKRLLKDWGRAGRDGDGKSKYYKGKTTPE